MAVFALTSTEVLQAGARLTCATNEVMLDVQAAELDATVFCSAGWTQKIAGLRSWTLSPSGFWDVASGGPDQLLWADMTAQGSPTSLVPIGATGDGAVAYVGAGMVVGLGPMGGTVGDVAGSAAKIAGVGTVARGVLASNVTAIAATTNGTGHQIGALVAGQTLRVGVHVLAATGTWSVGVQHDDNAGFSSPTTIAGTVAVTSGTAPLGGLITSTDATADDYWRVVFTRTSGTLTAMVTMAIS